jgi:hypothetical protein
MKEALLLLFNIFSFLMTSGCAHTIGLGRDYRGKIVDADSGGSIENVVVLATWSIHHPNAAGGWNEFYDAKETLTNENGEFSIPDVGTVVGFLNPMRLYIFKAGYKYLDTSWDSLRKMKTTKWEKDTATIPLKELTMEDQKKHIPPVRPDIPVQKMRLLTKEINKDRIKRGLDPFEMPR